MSVAPQVWIRRSVTLAGSPSVLLGLHARQDASVLTLAMLDVASGTVGRT